MTEEHSEENDETVFDSLGDYLRQIRIDRGLEMTDVVRETKISLINLAAIEDDNFDALPPAAFTRGLYTIYAKALDLVPEEILERFTEQNLQSAERRQVTPTPSILIKEVSAMAERPTAPPTMLLGVLFITIVLLVSLGCWYYSINPASFLSEKLRSLQSEQNILPTRSSGDIGTPDGSARYALSGYFPKDTIVEIIIDDKNRSAYAISGGQKQTWTAGESMEIKLPASSKATLSLNGVNIPLPPPIDDEIVISVPDYLLE